MGYQSREKLSRYVYRRMDSLGWGYVVTAGFKYGSGAVIKNLEGFGGNVSLDAIGVLALKE